MEKAEVKPQRYFNFDHTYSSLPGIFFTLQQPDKVPAPKLVIFNDALAKELRIDEAGLKSAEGVQVLAGNKTLGPAIAQAYAGHQFGCFTMLGDGRALLLGELTDKDGNKYDVQLKGAGKTPYSRGGDGKAALGPMLREYIISEGMRALGIPTTRSLAVVTTGEKVMREQPLDGAVLTRVASSHIRVGTFQYAARWGSLEELKALADYTMDRHFKKCQSQENPYVSMLKEIVDRQAALVAKWQLAGFIHGVMNTDNMAVSGETIDYGPCAFMDTYDPKTVFSSIDRDGRYAYGNQPVMAAWNLARLAEALLPLLHRKHDEAVRLAQEAVTQFQILYKGYWKQGMCAKLGIGEVMPEDVELIERLLRLMAQYKADYTNTFRLLTLQDEKALSFADTEGFRAWNGKWKERLKMQRRTEEQIREMMMANNPAVIPRNHKVEEVLAAATQKHDTHKMIELLKVIANPYDYSPIEETYIRAPESAGCYRTFCGT